MDIFCAHSVRTPHTENHITKCDFLTTISYCEIFPRAVTVLTGITGLDPGQFLQRVLLVGLQLHMTDQNVSELAFPYRVKTRIFIDKIEENGKWYNNWNFKYRPFLNYCLSLDVYGAVSQSQ